VSAAIEKTVVTLGDLLTVESKRLMQRCHSAIAWLELIEPLIERGSQRVETAGRFVRQEGVPRKPHQVSVDLSEDAAMEHPEVEGEPLAETTRGRLRSLVGPEVELARVHVDDRADAFAHAQRADAVTVGREIYFRSRAFAPQSPAGLGLIAHELTHVAESERPGIGWRRSTPDGVLREERLARGREQSAAQLLISPVVAPVFAPTPATASPSLPRASTTKISESAQLHPMRADADRPPSDVSAPAMQPAPSLDVIRRNLCRDLMNQIRVEFERGA
jgi:Domain of unknown function (DUF4157)